MDLLDALRTTTDTAAEAGSDDAVDGVAAAYVVRPRSAAEVADVLRVAAERGAVVGVRGAGSKLGWGRPPRALDVLLDTTGMAEILEHAAGDLVARVQPGVPLAALNATLAASRQMLALDPPEPSATVGGVVATNASGPRRLLYTAPRDLLIGITVALADGTLAKAGGKVVKNVAGYDLMKLFCGSLGTLGVVVECVVRLHPVPEATRAVVTPVADPDDAWAKVRAVSHSQVVPSAVELDWPDSAGAGRLTVLVEGIEAGVDDRAATMLRLVGGEPVDGTPDGWGARPWSSGGIGLKLSFEIKALARVLGVLRATGVPVRVGGHAAVGVLHAGLPPLEPARAASVVDGLRAALAAYDGAVVVLHAPADVKAALDPWGPVPALELMRRVKDRFDPEHRLSPGRFVGGI